jgi:hypothetical protein
MQEATSETRVDEPATIADLGPSWLLIPEAKREVALRRLGILLEYDGQRQRTKAEAQAAADSMGVKLRSFYAILKSWREDGRSPLTLVPHGPAPGARRSRLTPPVASELAKLAGSVAREQPDARVGDLLKEVKRRWTLDEGPPSEVTIRAYLNLKLAKNRPSGSLPAAFGIGEGLDDPATRFGEVLVIDHTAPADIVLRGDGRHAPVITMAIDLFAGVPVGAFVGEDYPNGDCVMAALDDAIVRLRKIAGTDDVAKPRVRLDTSRDLEWDGLSDELWRDGFSPIERVSGRIDHGAAAQRLLAGRLGRIALQPSKVVRGPGRHAASKESALSLDEVRAVVADAIEADLAARLPEGAREALRSAEHDGPAQTRLSVSFGGERETFAHDPFAHDPEARALNNEILRQRFGFVVQERLNAPSPTAGNGRGLRSPGLFKRALDRMVAEVAGAHLVRTEIDPPVRGRPSWEMRVEVDRANVKGLIWVELARRMTEIFMLEETLVQVTVVSLQEAASD